MAALAVTAWVSLESAAKSMTAPSPSIPFIIGDIIAAAIGIVLTMLSLMLAWDAVQAFIKTRRSHPAGAHAPAKA